MTTQFFERQEVQRKYTLWLVSAFIACILLVVAVINLVVLVGLGGDPGHVLRQEPEVVVWISAIVFGTILIASWHRSSQLRAGGAVIARALGGVQVNANDGDLKRQRLVNVVEEMAIAARIRKPQIFVLPNEAGINAFAAGNSPDEAAVAVTQGALDAFDREQLQAVIGHEFSHILNGDMKINMRLTAWIFGLCVISDLARRIMNKRGGGKGAARVKLIAFGIFVAGSAGALVGRLLQAAVSRRREHLADASAVQFTRNPQALQGAFIVMAANAAGTRLEHERAVDVAHMFFASSPTKLLSKFNASWFATHPPLEERVQALDARISPLKFRAMVSDQRRKLVAKAAAPGEGVNVNAPEAGSAALAAAGDLPLMAMAPAELATPTATATLEATPHTDTDTGAGAGYGRHGAGGDDALGRAPHRWTFPSSRRIAQSPEPGTTGRHQQRSSPRWKPPRSPCRPRSSPRCSPRIRRNGARSSPGSHRCSASNYSRRPRRRSHASRSWRRLHDCHLLVDLLTLLDGVEPADRKRLRAVARAFAPTVATGDMLRFSLTRILEKRLGKAGERISARAAAGTCGRGLRTVCGAGAVPFRRGQTGAERLSRRRHGNAHTGEVGAVSGTADRACGARHRCSRR